MRNPYKGRLTSQQIANIVGYRQNGASVCKTADNLGYSYPQVRAYVEWYESALTDLAPPPEEGPKILIYDIETAPAAVWTWAWWKTNVIAVERDWYMLSVAYKWMGDDEVHFFCIADDPEFTPDTTEDEFVVRRLHRLFNQADITIAHNGDRFDLTKANARFLVHNLGPTSPVQTIDTLKESRRYFNQYSHSLKELTRYLDIEQKMQNDGWDLWRGCMRGDPEWWEKMEEYNRQDVVALEELYLKIRPFIGTPGKRAHPNLGHWSKGKLVCPNCQSEKVHRRGSGEALHRTIVSEFQTIHCQNCGAYSRLRQRIPQPSPSYRVGAL